jgi:hypothetical protein
VFSTKKTFSKKQVSSSKRLSEKKRKIFFKKKQVSRFAGGKCFFCVSPKNIYFSQKIRDAKLSVFENGTLYNCTHK